METKFPFCYKGNKTNYIPVSVTKKNFKFIITTQIGESKFLEP